MNTTPIVDEPPHYMKPDSDCMGGPTNGYWRQFLTCSNGSCVIGSGETPEQANRAAEVRREEKNKFLAQSPIEQLRQIRIDAKGSYCSHDLNHTVELILRVLLDKN